MRLLLLAFCLAAVLPRPASAAWLRAASAKFVVYSHDGERDARERLDQLQKFDALLHLLTGIPDEGGDPSLPVYFVQGRDMRVFGMTDASVGGFYRANPGAIEAVLATDRAGGATNGVLAVLFHEYTHHFMFAHSRGTYPAWYVEGFAEYLMTATFRGEAAEFGDVDGGRARQLLGAPWLSMQTLQTARPRDLKRDQVPAFYAQSWLAVHYLLRNGGRGEAMRDYLAAINHGTAPETAFAQAFGTDYAGFGRELHRYLDSRRLTKTTLRELKVPPITVTVTTLPPSADPLLVPAVQLAVLPFRGATADPALLATVRKAAAQFPGDAFATRVQAEAEVKLGDRPPGTAMLDAALARTPEDADLLYLRGMTALTDAREAGGDEAGMAKARLWLARANRARPDDYRILAGHAATYPRRDFPDKEVPVLLHAAELAPQVAEVQASAAQMLARRGRVAEAKAMLLPIANDPHGGAAATYAAALIAEIDAGKFDKAP